MTDVRATAKTPVTVFVHVHYPDIWRDMSALLAERLTLPFHLVLTTSHRQDEIVLPRTPALLSVRLLSVENRGRDILPFLQAMAETNHFEIGLKLHTKKSPQREDGDGWRTELLESLLPPASGADAIVSRMRADQRIGFVTPAHFCLSVRPWVLLNAPGMHRIMSALGSDLTESNLDNVFFAGGSMFWFRRSALARLADRKLADLFETEQGQLDGTIAHAMERLFPVEAHLQGYVSLAAPALALSRPSMTLEELLALASRYADIPNRYFPAPYVQALPMGTVSATSAAAAGSKALLAAVYRASLPLGLRRWLRRLMRR
jgi:lipopolysaccharide biosynthesis protein